MQTHQPQNPASNTYAHTKEGRPPEEWEPLDEHLRAVATLARDFAEPFGADRWGELAGLWHDLGKYSRAFQSYLRTSSGVEDLHRSEVAGRVDHSTAGAQHAASRGIPGRLLAYGIAGHHAGLPDDDGGESGLSCRLKKRIEPVDAAPAELLARPIPPLPKLRLDGNKDRAGFALAFWTRMLFSCLVDADFLATEQFMDPERAALRPQPAVTLTQLLARLDQHLDQMQREAADTPVNRRRRDVLAACREKANLSPGLFSLSVPTGGGKTLSSLAFALGHAAKHNLRRVVYAIPFTSIIEQTADVFRAALGDLQSEVLEHHSNLEPDDPQRQSVRSRLAAENFDAPLVVTTNVQLFESLSANRSSRCRKLHRLARSVVILDEAQTLPPRLLAPTLAALDELARNYGATVVLCTATQPAIRRSSLFPVGLEGAREIIDDPRELHEALRRTQIETKGLTSDQDLVKDLRRQRQALCVVNSRRHAAALYTQLADQNALHLSASMCARHRSAALRLVRWRLRRGSRCRVVSTQVVEAGVDVDFPAVYRAEAGLDSIAQAAGRCNREGRLVDSEGRPRLGQVLVFGYDSNDYPTDSMIARGGRKFREVAPDHAEDLLSPAAIEAYFRLHYWHQGGDDHRGWDKGRDGVAIMSCFSLDTGVGLHAQFRAAADAYRLIDDAQTAILVPYGRRGRNLIAELERSPDPPDPSWLRQFDRKAQRYVVGVYDRELLILQRNGVLLDRHGRYYLGNRAAYDRKRGLTLEAIGLDVDRTVI